MSVHKGPDRRQHRQGFGLVALKRLDHQREPGRVGEQPDGDLRLQSAFLGEPGLAEPVTGVGLEVQRGHVIQHQAGWPQPGVCCARRGQPGPPGLFGEDGQTPLEGGIRRRGDADLVDDPQAVQFAGRLNDPREHQRSEHLVVTGGRREPQHLVGVAQRIPQVAHPRGGDGQRLLAGSRPQVHTQVQLGLPSGHPQPRCRLQRLKLGIIVRRADVLDIPRPPARGVHDLHRPGPRRRPNRAHIRHGRQA